MTSDVLSQALYADCYEACELVVHMHDTNGILHSFIVNEGAEKLGDQKDIPILHELKGFRLKRAAQDSS